MDERRRSRRAAPAHELNVTLGGNRPAKVVDVSPQGAHLELTFALNPRSECRVSLPLLGEIVRIKARVVHCKLVGFSNTAAGNFVIYHAGLEFLDVDSGLTESIRLAYPPPFNKPVRRGPIKVKVNVEALEHAADLGKHGAN